MEFQRRIQEECQQDQQGLMRVEHKDKGNTKSTTRNHSDSKSLPRQDLLHKISQLDEWRLYRRVRIQILSNMNLIDKMLFLEEYKNKDSTL